MQSHLEEAEDVTTSAMRLTSLAQHDDVEVRCAVARNWRTPVETLIDLADDAEADVRWAVARHGKLPADVLAGLAKDADLFVRASVAVNPRCEPSTLAWLAEDPEFFVRLETASNRSTPLEALLELEREGGEMLESLFANGSFPDERIADYVCDESVEIRLLAIGSGRLGSEDLSYLAWDSDARVRQAAAADTATPVEVLYALMEDPLRSPGGTRGSRDSKGPVGVRFGDWCDSFIRSEAIRAAVAENPSMPVDLLAPWLDDDQGDTDLQEAMWRRMASPEQ